MYIKEHTLQIVAIWSVLIVLFLIFCVFYALNLYQKSKNGRIQITRQYEYWVEVVKNHGNYPDGYYKLAVYAYMLGKKNEAMLSLKKAIYIDPSFEAAKRLEKQIEPGP